jgi:folate-binding protein YgfZ
MKELARHELSKLTLIRCSGNDAQKFLQAQLTNDVAVVTPQTSQYTGYCTPKGRLLATFLLCQFKDAYYLQLPSALADSVVERLRKFVLRAKVELRNAADEWQMLGVLGENGRIVLQQLFPPQMPGKPHEVAQADNAVILRLPGDRFQIVAKSEYASSLRDAVAKDIPPADGRVWEWLDIRQGIPVILPQTQEQFVPQMVNFDLIGGVSFSKGCYPGQEIIARTKYLGEIKRRMYLANVRGEEAPQPGDGLFSPMFGDQSAGTIVNSAPSPDGGHDVLAVLHTSAMPMGVFWKGDEPLNFLPLPYEVT